MVKMTCFRFNLDNPEHAKAWNYLHSMPAEFNVKATHFNRNDHISLFDKCVVKVTAIHSCIRGDADCSGRWV